MPTTLKNLPPELHLLIASYLAFPDRIYLKITCRYWNELIPRLSHSELLEAEIHPYAMEKDLYACRYCLRLRDSSRFAEKMLRRRRGKYGRDVEKRFCVECGLAPRRGEARYGPGAQIISDGVLYVVCSMCREFQRGAFDVHGRAQSECVSCWMRRHEPSSDKMREVTTSADEQDDKH